MTRVEVLKPGETCWQVAHAPRFRLMVDAADYFKALKQAMTEAEKSIFLIGWDFDFCQARSRNRYDDRALGYALFGLTMTTSGPPFSRR